MWNEEYLHVSIASWAERPKLRSCLMQAAKQRQQGFGGIESALLAIRLGTLLNTIEIWIFCMVVFRNLVHYNLTQYPIEVLMCNAWISTLFFHLRFQRMKQVLNWVSAFLNYELQTYFWVGSALLLDTSCKSGNHGSFTSRLALQECQEFISRSFPLESTYVVAFILQIC